ncbi:peptide chain release factor subunit 3 [Enteropsectra breve]|nr:peptide chain release factor subunit 3 [Enteropsectra breve]
MEAELEKLSLRPKRLVNIIFVGHVDSGKSTICGRIIVDLGLIDARTLEKYKSQAEELNRGTWYLSWCMDTNPEERSKGITTEVGTASFDYKDTKINILDAPGHKGYVQEMIDASSRADVGVLIASAQSGEFEAGFKGGQTKEHLLLLKSGGVEQLIVLVNKMDQCAWDEKRYLHIVEKVGNFTKKIFRNVTFIPVSGYEGSNIIAPKETAFYKGPAFLDMLNTIHIEGRDNSLCTSIYEKVKTSGSIYFYAKVDSGTLAKNTEVKILPLNKKDRVLSISTEDDVEVSETVIGESYKIKLKDYPEELAVGMKLVGSDNESFQICNEMYAQIVVLEVNKALTIGYTAIMHINLQVVACKITELITLEKKKVRVARKNERVIARISLENPIVVRCQKDKSDRFSLRDQELTVASGLVKKVIL